MCECKKQPLHQSPAACQQKNRLFDSRSFSQKPFLPITLPTQKLALPHKSPSSRPQTLPECQKKLSFLPKNHTDHPTTLLPPKANFLPGWPSACHVLLQTASDTECMSTKGGRHYKTTRLTRELLLLWNRPSAGQLLHQAMLTTSSGAPGFHSTWHQAC